MTLCHNVEGGNMPKDTFLNLPEQKKEKILYVLKKEFQSKPYQKVNIKSIMEKLDIARGSFYQYFENLEDSYFTILDNETVDIHILFIRIFNANERDLHKTLMDYGEQVANIIFHKDSYMIYKNKYLYWNEELNQSWNRKHKTHISFFQNKEIYESIDMEKIHFIKSIIHNLIERNFQEEWTKERFLEKYYQHIIWIEKGIQ